MSNLKLYVWEDVLQDWGSGIMFALAKDPDDARMMLALKMVYFPDDLNREPREIKDKEAFYVHGSM